MAKTLIRMKMTWRISRRISGRRMENMQWEHYGWTGVHQSSPAIAKELSSIDRESSHNLRKNFDLTVRDFSQQQKLRIEQIVMILRNLSFDRTYAIFIFLTFSCGKHSTIVRINKQKVSVNPSPTSVGTCRLTLYQHSRWGSWTLFYLGPS